MIYKLFSVSIFSCFLILSSCKEEVPSSELPTVIYSINYSLENSLNFCNIGNDQKHGLLGRLRAEWETQKRTQKILLEKKYQTQTEKIVPDCESQCSCQLWSDVIKDSQILASSYQNILKASEKLSQEKSLACLENMRKVFCGSEFMQSLMNDETPGTGP